MTGVCKMTAFLNERFACSFVKPNISVGIGTSKVFSVRRKKNDIGEYQEEGECIYNQNTPSIGLAQKNHPGFPSKSLVSK